MKKLLPLNLISNLSKFTDERKKSVKKTILSAYASTFKYERLRLGRTLEYVTEGTNTSKSYVSKFENNILQPNEDVLRLLFERINIDYDRLKLYKQEQDINTYLYLYYHFDYQKIAELFENMDDSYYLSTNSLIKLIAYLTANRFDDFIEEAKKLDDIKKTLIDDEFHVFLALSIEFYLKTAQYLKAKEYMEALDSLRIEHSLLEILREDQKFLINHYLNEKSGVSFPFDSPDLNKEFSLKRSLRRKILEMENRTFPADKNPFDQLEKENIPEVLLPTFHYAKVSYYIKQQQFENAIKFIEEKKLNDWPFLGLLAYCIRNHILKDNEYYKTGLKLLKKTVAKKDVTAINRYHCDFVRLIVMEIEEQPLIDIYDYYNDVIIVNLPIQQNLFYDSYIASQYIKVLGKISHYKEIYLFLQNFNFRLKNLQLDLI